MAKVLVVDDEQSVQQVLRSFLEIDGHHVLTAGNYDEALFQLAEGEADLVVTDVVLGKKTGLEILNVVNDQRPNTPVIVITGQPTLETAATCVRSGAFDLLQKPLDRRDFINATHRAIREGRRRKKLGALTVENRRHRRTLGQKVERQNVEIERATKALIKSEHRYSSLVAAVPEIILEFDKDYRCIWYNDVAQRFYGDHIYNKHLYDLSAIEDEKENLKNRISSMPRGSQAFLQIKCHTTRKDGTDRWVSWRIKPLHKSSGEFYGVLATARDITEMANLEDQVRQKAKLETIGQLAGGVAHDFNNMLGAILAQSNLLQRIMPQSQQVTQSLGSIETGVLRAKELTDKLLGFAQCGKTKNCPFDIHKVVEEVTNLLNRTLDKRIVLCTNLKASRSTIFGDPSQLYQVILNLVINSRDAILERFQENPNPNLCGTINIATSLVDSLDYTSPTSMSSFIRISIHDNGCGIPRDVEQKIFEPFFTTKKDNGNSGMGLAMVYGIITNHDGYISVTSLPEMDTAFFIHLPVAAKEIEITKPEAIPIIKPGKSSILLIDDEELVRSSLSALLRSIGYQTFCAGNGDEALSVYQSALKDIDLVILDLMMPGLQVSSCIKRLKTTKPSIKILLTSGYGLNDKSQEILTEAADGFIQKPCDLSELSKIIATTLSGS